MTASQIADRIEELEAEEQVAIDYKEFDRLPAIRAELESLYAQQDAQ